MAVGPFRQYLDSESRSAPNILLIANMKILNLCVDARMERLVIDIILPSSLHVVYVSEHNYYKISESRR